MYECKIVADSLAPCGKRLTTITATYPRFIHAEVLTHRDRARNSASSRAIPWKKMMAAITENPVIPIRWGSEQKGMQTGGEIEAVEEAETLWLEARDNAIESAQKLAALGVHKSLVNRLTEPFMWITVVMTATEWQNFFRLRCHPDAEIHFQKIAGMIRDELEASTPVTLEEGEWHLPFIQPDEIANINGYFIDENGQMKLHPFVPRYIDILPKVSVARCARVSYLTHEGKRDMEKDLELFDKLVQGSGFGHFSPHEHVAKACSTLVRSGPYIGWEQYRKSFPLENQEG